MKNAKTYSLQEVIDVVKSLSYDDQEILLDIIGKRLRKYRRARLLKDVAEAREAYRKGEVQRGTVDDLMKVLDE